MQAPPPSLEAAGNDPVAEPQVSDEPMLAPQIDVEPESLAEILGTEDLGAPPASENQDLPSLDLGQSNSEEAQLLEMLNEGPDVNPLPENIFSQMSQLSTTPEEFPSELPDLEPPPAESGGSESESRTANTPAKAKPKGKKKKQTKSTKKATPVASQTPPASKSSSQKSKTQSKSKSSSTKASTEVVIPVSRDTEQHLISNAEFMQNLSSYIKGQKSISSAQECLNEINNFRQQQIDLLLGKRVVEKLESRFKSGKHTSAQPIGSLADVIGDVIKFYKQSTDPTKSLSDRENLSKMGDGYLAWIEMQIGMVVPQKFRLTASNLINERLSKSLGYGSWAVYDPDEDIISIHIPEIRDKIVKDTIAKGKKRQNAIEKDQQFVDEQQKKLAAASSTAQSSGGSPARVLRKGKASPKKVGGKKKRSTPELLTSDEESATGGQSDEDEEVGGGSKVIRRKDLQRELLTVMYTTNQVMAGINDIIDKIQGRLDDQEFNEIAPIIDFIEARYKDLKTQSDPFFSKYSDREQFSLPWSERALLRLEHDRVKLIAKRRNASIQSLPRLFLYDWLENIYQAFVNQKFTETSFVRDLLLADNIQFPEKNTAKFDTPLFIVSTVGDNKISVQLKEAADPSNANHRAQVIFAIAYLAAWLVSDSIIKIDSKQISLSKPNISGSLIGVRDWIQSELCTSVGTNESCSLLFGTLEVVTGPKTNTVTDTIAKLLQDLNVKIIVGGKEERDLINFQELCSQCKTNAKCEEGTFAIDQIQERFPSGYADLANAEEYARALLPNHWILRRATYGKNGNPQYSQVDLRDDAVLLIAQRLSYTLHQPAMLKIQEEKSKEVKTIKIPAGEWKTAEELQQTLSEKLAGVLQVGYREYQELPEFSLQSVHPNEKFSIEDEGALELLGLIGMNSAAKYQQVRTSNTARMATSRAAGFLLAVKSSSSFPHEQGNRIAGALQLNSAQLANSIEIDANCVRSEYNPALKSLLLLYLLSNNKLLEKLSPNPDDSHLLLDLPKLPREHEFSSSGKKSAISGKTLVAVNSAAEWEFWSQKWKFTTGFPKELSLKPSKMKADKVYALDKQSAKFSKLGADKRSSLVAGSDELKKHGPESDSATTWTGLMLRKVPTKKEMLQLLQTNFSARK